MGQYFEIFWLCIPITQNPVCRQLVPFDMLSHISHVCSVGFSYNQACNTLSISVVSSIASFTFNAKYSQTISLFGMDDWNLFSLVSEQGKSVIKWVKLIWQTICMRISYLNLSQISGIWIYFERRWYLSRCVWVEFGISVNLFILPICIMQLENKTGVVKKSYQKLEPGYSIYRLCPPWKFLWEKIKAGEEGC